MTPWSLTPKKYLAAILYRLAEKAEEVWPWHLRNWAASIEPDPEPDAIKWRQHFPPVKIDSSAPKGKMYFLNLDHMDPESAEKIRNLPAAPEIKNRPINPGFLDWAVHASPPLWADGKEPFSDGTTS